MASISEEQTMALISEEQTMASISTEQTIRIYISIIGWSFFCTLCTLVMFCLVLLASISRCSFNAEPVKVNQLMNRPLCDEIYVVGEGETLHSIIDKCGDPFIVEQNPHIQDPDDVLPGLLIRITPKKMLR